MNRKQYWDNDYLKYWESKVKEANSSEDIKVNKNDVKTISDNIVFEFCEKVNIKEKYKILDFGCGFCRTYPYFHSKGATYYGIDISESMINESKKRYPELNDYLFVSEGEELPFDDNKFDFVLCFGVFDACYQEKALSEILRVLKVNGTAIITGKNDLYYNDDDKAMVAEVNARKKEHPNYFTDVKSMIKQLEQNNISVSEAFYFPRRGDFQIKNYQKDIPDKFYEYLLIIQKDFNGEINNFEKFSSSYSKTFNNLNNI